MNDMETKTPDPDTALTAPPPGKHESSRLKYLVEEGYLSLETTSFDFEEIPTEAFEEAQEAVAESATSSPLHADLKAVATWYLEQGEETEISYEQQYPQSARVADVSSVPIGHYVEVGYVEDISRVHQTLGIDVVMRGSSVSSVLRRHPWSDIPTERGGVRAVLSIPFPVHHPSKRAWDLDRLKVHTYTLGSTPVTTPNRRHTWWGEEDR